MFNIWSTRKTKENGAETVFAELMAKKFLKMMKDIIPQSPDQV